MGAIPSGCSIMKSKTIKPRDKNVLGMIGKSRVFKDRRTSQKKDVVGRKAKHKERESI